eukprot:1617685-Rhodomonas_salina.1
MHTPARPPRAGVEAERQRGRRKGKRRLLYGESLACTPALLWGDGEGGREGGREREDQARKNWSSASGAASSAGGAYGWLPKYSCHQPTPHTPPRAQTRAAPA